MNTELNLNDPKTIERLKEVDVLSQPVVEDREEQQLSSKIAALQKGSQFKMKLSVEQLQRVEREASVLGLTWQAYLEREIISKVLGGLVGQPLITRPSFCTGDRVSAPKGLVNRG
jgi:predicted DNA binding CopG/RHH family protein